LLLLLLLLSGTATPNITANCAKYLLAARTSRCSEPSVVAILLMAALMPCRPEDTAAARSEIDIRGSRSFNLQHQNKHQMLQQSALLM
jgi:hypothetical protein